MGEQMDDRATSPGIVGREDDSLDMTDEGTVLLKWKVNLSIQAFIEGRKPGEIEGERKQPGD
jgi:hypothetical protein